MPSWLRPTSVDPPLPTAALTRRVVMTMFAAGGTAVCLNWALEWRNGQLDDINAVAYPFAAAVCAALLLVLWRRPAMLGPVRWVGFLTVQGVLLPQLAAQVVSEGALMGNYNFVTLLNWLPLSYALAFFLLEARVAAWATGTLLAAILAAALFRGQLAVPSATVDRDLLLNTLGAHGVLVVCLTSMLWLRRAVATQVEQARELRHLAGTDPLTGLANRRHALHLLERHVGDRRLDARPAVLWLDLDHFKQINDRCGHEMGDRVLCEVAAALRAHTRETDAVARWGGEEFLVVLPRTREDEARELAERLRGCVEALRVLDRDGRHVPVTVSIGLSSLDERDTLESWLRRADEALYRAKGLGRNRSEAGPD